MLRPFFLMLVDLLMNWIVFVSSPPLGEVGQAVGRVCSGLMRVCILS